MSLVPQFVFIADRVHPRLGMEKALESLLFLLPQDRVELVLISGAPPANPSYPVTSLNQPLGWRGRILALPELRRIATTRSRPGTALIAVGSWAFIAVAVATVFSRCKLILWEHTVLPWRIRNEWQVAAAVIALRLLSFRLERVICVSESNCAAVRPFVWPMRRLTVIPNLTSGARSVKPLARPIRPGDVVRLVGIGSLERRKNWALAARAMQHLPENYTLEIAGDGDQYEDLRTLINKLGLEDRVRLLGYVPDADKLIANADIVVHPSLAETFGYTLVEAAASRRPVVVADMPVMNEMVSAFVCGERSVPTPKEFAAAIVRARTATYDYAAAARARERYLSDGSILGCWDSLSAGRSR